MIKEIQCLRGIAILAVIAIHTTAAFTTVHPPTAVSVMGMTLDALSNFAVPLFVFISGYVLSTRYYDSFSIITFYRKRLVSVIIPTAFFFLLYFIYLHGVNGLFSENTIRVFLGMREPFHFFFIRIILELYLIYPLIMLALRKIDARILIALSFLYLLSLSFMQLPTLGLASVSSLPYFLLGITASINPDKLVRIMNKEWTAPILGLALAVTWLPRYYGADLHISPEVQLWANYMRALLTMLFNVSIILALFKATAKYQLPKLYSLGQLSFGIYLIHVFYLWEVPKWIAPAGITPRSFIYYPVVFLAIAGLSYLSIYLMGLTPLRHIAGVRSRPT